MLKKKNLLQQEQGAILILLALLFVPLFGFAVFVINRSYYAVVRSDLRAAADAASDAAVANYCGTRACYTRARLSAVALINRHRLHGGLGQSAFAQLDPTVPSHAWETDELVVQIHRGRWFSGGLQRVAEVPNIVPGTERFESFDHLQAPGEPPDLNAWQNAHPGTPTFLAANAAMVSVRRQSVKTFFPVFGDLDYSTGIASVSVVGPIGTVKVAPIALPACALLDDNGNFAPQLTCDFDRIITEVDRYCGPGVDCDIVPGFLYYFSHVDPGPVPVFTDARCSFQTKRFARASDHFGVAGLPAHLNPVTEGTILQVLNVNDGLVDAALGERFEILQSGFTATSTETAFENALLKGGEPKGPYVPDDAHPDPHSALGWFYTIGRLDNAVSYCSDPNNVPSGFVNPAKNHGACNSLFDHYPPVMFQDENYACAGSAVFPERRPRYQNTAGLFSIFSNLASGPPLTWKVYASVIASSAPCRGAGGATDPLLSSELNQGRHYSIIGFIPVTVFDMDIGRLPDNAGPVQVGACMNHGWAAARQPWGFFGSAGRPCNMLRLKHDCDAKVLASPASGVWPRGGYAL